MTDDIREAINKVQRDLGKAGFKSTIISTQCLSGIHSDIESLYTQGIFDGTFYEERLSHYHYDVPGDFHEARSIIVTAAPQPKVTVEFSLSGTSYLTIIPPTYSYDTDERALGLLRRLLSPFGYMVSEAILPVKALAVRCQLATYGRNNITYIDDWGSYFRLKVFYSDLPCREDTWQQYTMMDHCKTCTTCLKSCPTKAISEDRFIFHAERCLTFLNEGEHQFPDWVDPAWHNCLIGCMICQDVCPLNKDVRSWTSEGESFSDEETRVILAGVPSDSLPEAMVEKLKRVYMWDDYHVLKRNLRAIIKRIKGAT